MQLKLYIEGDNPECRKAKAWLEKNGVDFEEIDIQKNPSEAKTLKEQGIMSFPALKYGEGWLVGFSEETYRILISERRSFGPVNKKTEANLEERKK